MLGMHLVHRLEGGGIGGRGEGGRGEKAGVGYYLLVLPWVFCSWVLAVETSYFYLSLSGSCNSNSAKYHKLRPTPMIGPINLHLSTR